MDRVVSPATAIAMNRLGNLAVRDLEDWNPRRRRASPGI
jgi:hypothetical protein